ncbi:MAG: DUF4412 domain-containing protein [Synergistaceae bacterium]|nr:DUF4412 domain-containing protein [Synergistaceae bacterium]
MIGRFCVKRAGRILFVAALVLVLSAALAAAAEFSAEMVMKGPDGQAMNGKVFVKGQKIRQEMQQDGETVVTILRVDRRLSWILMVDEKAYLEMKMRESSEDPSLVEKTDPAKVRRLGKETVNGFLCEKVQVTDNGTVVTQWISEELAWPIKGEVKSPKGISSHEYRNIRKGGVSDSLFEIPPGFQKMAVPGMQ